MSEAKWAGSVKDGLGDSKPHAPKKEIDHIKSYKSHTKGDVIHEHHHTHPDHHPMEKHTSRGDDEMAQHMLQNLGSQSPDAEPTDGAGADPNAAAAPADGSAPPPTGAGTSSGPSGAPMSAPPVSA